MYVHVSTYMHMANAYVNNTCICAHVSYTYMYMYMGYTARICICIQAV